MVRGGAATAMCAVSAQKGPGLIYLVSSHEEDKQTQMLEAVEAVIEGRRDVIVIVDGDSAIDWEKVCLI